MAFYCAQGHIVLLLFLSADIVFSTPPPGYVATPGPVDEHPPKYEYGYVVSDNEGSTQGHVETRDGIYALGRYHVSLPDGSAQKVTYFADDWGYHPLVSYTSSNEHATSHTQFAVGDKAVSALKDAGSPAGNLINNGVHVLNAGASGHYHQSQQLVTTPKTVDVPTTVVPAVTYSSTTPSPLPTQVTFHPAQSTVVEHQPTITTVSDAAVTPASIPISQQQGEIRQVVDYQQDHQVKVTQPTSFLQPIVALSSPQLTGQEDHQYSVSVSTTVPPVNYLTTKQNQHFSWQQKDQTSSPLGSILLKEVPSNVEGHSSYQTYQTYETSSEGPLRIQIVTPTPILRNQASYPALSEQSFSPNFTEGGSFTHDGQNVQITSYLADTNRVLHFGDRIQSKDQYSDQKIFDQIQKHAKLRIFQDLQTNTLASTSTLKPIIVTATPITTTTETTLHSSIPSRPLVNIESHSSGESGYTSVSEVSQGSVPVNTPETSIGNFVESNSLVEKSDYLTSVGVTGGGFSFVPRHFETHGHFAPLQAGLAILTAPEKQPKPTPVTEESYEDNSVYKIANIEQSDVGSYQALGYEQRLVDPKVTDAVREKDPIIKEQKKYNLAVQQEIELRQVQDSIQELQQKIINEIDSQHEEEQKKQEAVANERLKHLDSLKKVAEITEDVKVDTTGSSLYTAAPVTNEPFVNEEFHGPDYLPPHPTGASLNQYQHGSSYASSQQIDYSVSSHSSEGNIDNNVGLAPPPLPPSFVEIEKPVIIEKPVAIEKTKFVEIEKPIYIKETVPVEKTNVVEVEKTVPLPVPVTRVVHVERPVPIPTPFSVPHPVPIPYAVPHAIGIPYPQFIQYTEILPVPFKQYHPVFIHTKNSQFKESQTYGIKPSKRMPEPVFQDPNPELFQRSHSYHTIPLHLKSNTHKSGYRHYLKTPTISGRNRNNLKNLRIEYGGFKPPLVPSTEFSDEPKPSQYGPSVKE